MALAEIDRHLLERCLQRKPRAWEDFVDRFMGLVVHVVQHSAAARSIRLTPEDRDDLCAEVFLQLVRDDFATLRHFRGQSSLATYLAVVSRRIVVKELLQQRSEVLKANSDGSRRVAQAVARALQEPDHRIEDREEVERLLEGLPEDEAEIVRMYHLEQRSYEEISQATGVPENSIGPILSRARLKLRRGNVNQAAG